MLAALLFSWCAGDIGVLPYGQNCGNYAMTLRIGWLAYGLERPLSGVTRYALELGRALGERSDCTLVYLTPYRNGPFRNVAGVHTAFLPGCRRLPALMILGSLTIASAARRYNLDLVHDPVGIAPFAVPRRAAPFKRVVTIHDAIAYRYPVGYPWLNNVLHRYYLPALLPQVDRVTTVSEHARADLRRFLPGLPETQVVPPAVGRQFRPVATPELDATLTQLGIRRPYILSVGAQQARKNLPRLMAAYAKLRLRRADFQLVLAGPALWRYPPLEQALRKHGSGGITLLGYVPERSLPALYSGAALFVLPSLYEGFGIPALEAMACATPVVCSNGTALPETVGTAALLVDPQDVGALTAGMEQVLTDRSLASDLRARGLDHARTYTWTRAATQTIAVYRSLLERRPAASGGNAVI